ncbi:nuclear transport factor 2 family protein [Bradyrhizobium tropiciagri]|uniref:nuclear transport factor 2 family protein n=1 Tax=Bradyrhizobium tropiciagri TaxID=312253 RepID=UPI001BAB6C72|nr:nuclear transport factor 2 family protein [Bradyrhizobium tropiciagri]MBR0870601.1 nuclear transport factor 2 family protein [Bradyrhizobium tropiciagri]
MSAADNKKLVQEMFAIAGDPDPAVREKSLFMASLADDAVWTVTGQYSWSRSFTGKQSIMTDLHGHVRSKLVERGRTIAHRIIADGDIVVVEAKGNNLTRQGQRYDNDYCLVFRFDGGRIREVREYCDSVLTERALGPFPAAEARAAG